MEESVSSLLETTSVTVLQTILELYARVKVDTLILVSIKIQQHSFIYDCNNLQLKSLLFKKTTVPLV